MYVLFEFPYVEGAWACNSCCYLACSWNITREFLLLACCNSPWCTYHNFTRIAECKSKRQRSNSRTFKLHTKSRWYQLDYIANKCAICTPKWPKFADNVLEFRLIDIIYVVQWSIVSIGIWINFTWKPLIPTKCN